MMVNVIKKDQKQGKRKRQGERRLKDRLESMYNVQRKFYAMIVYDGHKKEGEREQEAV